MKKDSKVRSGAASSVNGEGLLADLLPSKASSLKETVYVLMDAAIKSEIKKIAIDQHRTMAEVVEVACRMFIKAVHEGITKKASR
jgi:hypothetical protein